MVLAMLTNFRTFSNKENATFPLPSPLTSAPLLHGITSPIPSASKPRVSNIGIGRAPAKRTHAAKPYDRVGSVSRAKTRATSPEKRVTRSSKVVPSKSTSTSSTKSIHNVSASTLSAARASTMMRATARMAKIPLRLPRPVISPVQYIPGAASHIPVDYTLHRLSPHLPALLLVASQFIPQPHLSTWTPSDHHRSMAFGIPKVIASDAEMEDKIRGREPDICLAVKGKGQEHVPERLIPVSSIVYAAQCSNWQSITSAAPLESTWYPRSAASDLPTISEDNEDVQLGSDDRHDEDADPDSSFASDSTLKSLASTRTTSSTESDETYASTPGLLQLPLEPLTVPHIPSFATLHTHLHLPNRSLFSALLGLSVEHTAPNSARPALGRWSTAELMARLEWMHGFWSNVCALGVGGDRTWCAMGEAWGAVVDVLIARSVRPPQSL